MKFIKVIKGDWGKPKLTKHDRRFDAKLARERVRRSYGRMVAEKKARDRAIRQRRKKKARNQMIRLQRKKKQPARADAALKIKNTM